MKTEGGFLITNIKQISDRIFNRILSQKNIGAFNGAQGRILYVLWQKDGISQRELAEAASLAATTLTGMIDRMEASGLLEKVPAPGDRRKTLLCLTPRARGLQKDYNEVSQRMNAVFYKGFSAEEITGFEANLRRVLENLKAGEQCPSGTENADSAAVPAADDTNE